MFRIGLFFHVAIFGFGAPGLAGAAEYFVAPAGLDSHDGRSRESAFATIQHGVDALEPGDTLTILPGEYPGAVARNGLGSAEVDTIIRAEIPGTVFLQGDVPAPNFEPLDGSQFVYAADFDPEATVASVLEVDTLSVLLRKPGVRELEFTPGAFFHDTENAKLFISPSDMRAAGTHRYRVSVVPTHGIYLAEAVRVRIEGLGVSGFHGMELLTHHSGTLGGTWGIFLNNAKSCVIRDCHVWLNSFGIGINSDGTEAGDNLIEQCASWGNISLFTMGDSGGLTLFRARRDVIRNSRSFRNKTYGINIYGTGTDGGAYGDPNVPGNDHANRSQLLDNLAWGNFCDFKIKTGTTNFHTIERGAGPGLWSVTPTNTAHCLIGRGMQGADASTNIVLSQIQDLDPGAQFADPVNHDYRLQSTSQFRGAAPAGGDAGPFPFEANVFFVEENGDDGADGLSVQTAWRSLEQAARALRPGDTLYLLPGSHAGGFSVQIAGTAELPVNIRGRGAESARIEGGLLLEQSRYVNFERLSFVGPVGLGNGKRIEFRNCRFEGESLGLRIDRTEAVRIVHCAFTGFSEAAIATGPGPETGKAGAAGLRGIQQWFNNLLDRLRGGSAAKPSVAICRDLFLQGNLFENRRGHPALRLQSPDELLYSGYNAYADEASAWWLAAGGQAAKPVDFASSANIERGICAAFGRAPGPYRTEPAAKEMHMVRQPQIHSVGATSANIEWITSLPATNRIAWGETEDCPNELQFDGNRFATFSLTGLEPGKTYYFRVLSAEIPSQLEQEFGAQAMAWDDPPLHFTTLAATALPKTLYVAQDGNDANDGLSRAQALRTLQQAADLVQPGDTVLVGAGTYSETVRVRVSGEPQAPITFRAAPGERVVLDGAREALNQAFVVGGKHHVRFDGFRLVDFNMFPQQTWPLFYAGEFQLYASSDIQITRCFSDGRGGYSAIFVTAWQVPDLVLRNCVATNKMGGALFLTNCPGLVVENCVIACPMISAFVLRNRADEPSLFRNNIITDMLEKKSVQNIPLLTVDGRVEGLRMQSNCFLLRSFPPGERSLLYKVSVEDTAKYIFDSLYVDPEFSAVAKLRADGKDPGEFSPGALMSPEIELNFDSFFATHPEVISRGIGLQPEAFTDF